MLTLLMSAHRTDPPDRQMDAPTKEPKASKSSKTNGIVTKGHGEKITYDGKSMTIYQWARHIGLSPGRLYHRIKTYGWPLEQALKPERRPRPPTYLRHLTPETPDGPITKPMSVWSDELGIPMATISRRLARGWTDTQALDFAPGPREQYRLDAAALAEATDPFDTESFGEEEYDPDPFRILDFPEE